MVKFLKFVLMVFILFFSFSQTAMSQSYLYSSGEKFVGGIANVVTGVGELPKNVIISSREKGAAYGMTIGLVGGIMHTVGRTVIGALDVVTCMIPTGPSVHPTYIWNHFHVETTYGSQY